MRVVQDGIRNEPPDVGITSPVAEDGELRSRYEGYRRRQAAALVSILPREAIRPLYARAREWSDTEGLGGGEDPLATLLSYLQELIPFPPMEIWLADRQRHFQAHLEEEFISPQAHRQPSSPVTMDSRGVELAGRRWVASLNLFRRDEAWRGFISFRSGGDQDVVRTADIFREEEPAEIRSRFLAFHDRTLQSFLRSVLP